MSSTVLVTIAIAVIVLGLGAIFTPVTRARDYLRRRRTGGRS